MTATPTLEAYAFFNDNIIEEYTYENSIVDGVNVPNRVYRIKTEQTEHGGAIEKGTVIETTRNGKKVDFYISNKRIDYTEAQLDRSIVSPEQIRLNLEEFKKSIYTDLFPERKVSWNYLPKLLSLQKMTITLLK